jgi:hypothetical protein
MGFLNDDNGRKSMMRLMTLIIVVSGLVWGSVEVLISFFHPEFDLHETLILTTISIGVTGKGTQKALEMLKKKNEDETGNI